MNEVTVNTGEMLRDLQRESLQRQRDEREARDAARAKQEKDEHEARMAYLRAFPVGGSTEDEREALAEADWILQLAVRSAQSGHGTVERTLSRKALGIEEDYALASVLKLGDRVVALLRERGVKAEFHRPRLEGDSGVRRAHATLELRVSW
jgi:hypothetical protein